MDAHGEISQSLSFFGRQAFPMGFRPSSCCPDLSFDHTNTAMFYELSPLGWAGATWGIRPIAQHVRVIPDYAPFRGFFVAGSNQVSSIFDNNLVTGAWLS